MSFLHSIQKSNATLEDAQVNKKGAVPEGRAPVKTSSAELCRDFPSLDALDRVSQRLVVLGPVDRFCSFEQNVELLGQARRVGTREPPIIESFRSKSAFFYF